MHDHEIDAHEPQSHFFVDPFPNTCQLSNDNYCGQTPSTPSRKRSRNSLISTIHHTKKEELEFLCQEREHLEDASDQENDDDQKLDSSPMSSPLPKRVTKAKAHQNLHSVAKRIKFCDDESTTISITKKQQQQQPQKHHSSLKVPSCWLRAAEKHDAQSSKLNMTVFMNNERQEMTSSMNNQWSELKQVENELHSMPYALTEFESLALSDSL